MCAAAARSSARQRFQETSLNGRRLFLHPRPLRNLENLADYFRQFAKIEIEGKKARLI